MKKSINQIRLELKAIADAHLQVNDYAWKDFLRAYTENDLNYPLMCAYYPSGNIYMNQTQIQLNIVICDRIEKDWNKNLNEVESDTLQICRDIFNVLNESSRWQRIGRVSNCVVSKFVERSGDEVAGHTMQIDFLIRDNSGVCDLPMEDYNFDQAISQGCPSVDIFNSDLSYTAEVASGDSLELPDIDYAVKNSLGTTLAGATVPSVSNIETTLGDVDNIDSDGSTVPTPAGVPFTCTPNAPCDDAILTLNTNQGNVLIPSGVTANSNLLDLNGDIITPESVSSPSLNNYEIVIDTATNTWNRNPDWLPMPTIDPLINNFAGLFLVYEYGVNATTIRATNNAFDIDWGDGTTATSDNTIQLKVFDYSTLAGTVYVDGYGRNYKQVMITLTETGAATPTLLYIDQASGVASSDSINYYVDIVCSLPDVSTLRLSNTRALRVLERFICHDNALVLYPSTLLINTNALRVLTYDFSTMFNFSSFLRYTGNITELNGVQAPFNFTLPSTGAYFLGNCYIKELGDLTLTTSSTLIYFFYQSLVEKIGNISIPNATDINSFLAQMLLLVKVDSIYFPSATNMTNLCSYSTNLEEIHMTDCSSVTTTTNAFINCYALNKITATGLTVGISFANGSMGETAINELFTSLGTASGSQTITVTGNPGAGTCDTTIATAKGWTVAT